MKLKKLIALICALILTVNVYAFSAQGQFTASIKHIVAVKNNAGIDLNPKDYAYCRKQYQSLIGEPLYVHYQISPNKTLAKLRAHRLQLMAIRLHPLGIGSIYAFQSDQAVMPGFPNSVIRVNVDINAKNLNRHHIIVLAKSNDAFDCVLLGS